jgi:hypothetical protein
MVGAKNMIGRTLFLLHEQFAIARLPPEGALPAWVDGSLSSVTRTPEELSILCPAERVFSEIDAEPGWRGLRVAGTLDFSEVGVMASLSGPLAEAGVSVFVISTYDTDYLFVRGDSLAEAVRALRQAGHHVMQEE